MEKHYDDVFHKPLKFFFDFFYQSYFHMRTESMRSCNKIESTCIVSNSKLSTPVLTRKAMVGSDARKQVTWQMFSVSKETPPEQGLQIHHKVLQLLRKTPH